MDKEVFIKNINKNANVFAEFSGYFMTKEEIERLADRSVVPERVYKQFLSRINKNGKE